MIKKLAFFLFACSLSGSYAYATSAELQQCYYGCWQKIASCTGAGGLGSSSPICQMMLDTCTASCDRTHGG
ncbi:hypothetical protein GQ37_026260 [Janthinobacterium sp. BJB1]|uniref:hypothetical protein n=1 Tax=Janthinobacterium sp. GW458P TaxID=1981504 RepID=UPI000A3212D4|nr:hypothetical protein [Janthinobacterium sp. GW458P]MBE3028455.1 hypothetical protein [Janthinobacterium sp. GW458P]PJC95775.1 hypothetical protein GQ37_026260 [Janthinobacterium sp. BJB1]